jgi:hypothetical protein
VLLAYRKRRVLMPGNVSEDKRQQIFANNCGWEKCGFKD